MLTHTCAWTTLTHYCSLLQVSPDYASYFVCTDEGKERSSEVSRGGGGRAYKAYPSERAMLHIARPWVAFDRTAKEVASGGVGFGRDAIRRDRHPSLATYLHAYLHLHPHSFTYTYSDCLAASLTHCLTQA